jgi:predicted ArsR family transcriptional regulator
MSISDASRALASVPRRRLFALLCEAPHDAHQLAAATGLHVTTVRFHLEVLHRAGLVSSRPQPRTTAGRPRTVYSATTSPEQPDGYQTLTRLLATHLADTPEKRAERAERAGTAWSAEVAADREKPAESTSEGAVNAVNGLFKDLGFDPELAGTRAHRRIDLHACPFRATARANPEVVCSLHLGLLQGFLAQITAPPMTVELRPFVEPSLCAAHLSPIH